MANLATGQTVGEVAKSLGLKSFDAALPLAWVNDFERKTGFFPVAHFVWSYDDNSLSGKPVALTTEAAEALASYE